MFLQLFCFINALSFKIFIQIIYVFQMYYFGHSFQFFFKNVSVMIIFNFF